MPLRQHRPPHMKGLIGDLVQYFGAELLTQTELHRSALTMRPGDSWPACTRPRHPEDERPAWSVHAPTVRP